MAVNSLVQDTEGDATFIVRDVVHFQQQRKGGTKGGCYAWYFVALHINLEQTDGCAEGTTSSNPTRGTLMRLATEKSPDPVPARNLGSGS
jgi:hypothetical protein